MTTHHDRLMDIADRIGVEFGVSTAERSRDMAELLVSDMGIMFASEEDREDLVAVVSEGCGVFLRRRHSQSRAKATRSIVSSAKSIVGAKGPQAASAQQTLPINFPITVPGNKTVRAGNATCLDIRAFVSFIESQQRGFERSRLFCESLIPLWDGVDEAMTLDELVASGLVTMDDIARIAESA